MKLNKVNEGFLKHKNFPFENGDKSNKSCQRVKEERGRIKSLSDREDNSIDLDKMNDWIESWKVKFGFVKWCVEK